MTTKMRWFKFYPGDWALDTQGMTPLAKGIYIDMLCMQWSGRRLPATFEELSAMMPAMTDRIYRELMQHFEDRDGWLVNRRLEAEKGDAERRSSNARAGATAKWESNAAAMQEQCSSNAGAMLQQCYTDTDTDTDTEAETETEGCTARKRAVPTDSVAWSREDGWQGITDRDRSDWAVAYPAVGIDRELAAADQWLKANPEKARKKKWRAFLTRWLGRSQERGGSSGVRPEPIAAPRPPQRDRSHIPEDCAEGQDHLFWDGNFPNIPSTYTDTAGNLRHTRTRRIICAAEA